MTVLRTPKNHPHPNRRRRHGAVYVFVLSTAVFVSTIAVAVLMAAQVNGRVVAQGNDASKAEALAESAIDFALESIAADVNWKTDNPANFVVGPLNLGEGSISYTLVDNGDATFTLYGTGRVRAATKIYSVRCAVSTPAGYAYPILVPMTGTWQWEKAGP